MERDPLVQAVADNIQKYLDANNVSALELAKRAGTNRTAVYDILSGKSQSPGVITLAKLAHAMDASLMDLIVGEDAASFRDRLAERLQMLPESERARMEAMVEAMIAAAGQVPPAGPKPDLKLVDP